MSRIQQLGAGEVKSVYGMKACQPEVWSLLLSFASCVTLVKFLDVSVPDCFLLEWWNESFIPTLKLRHESKKQCMWQTYSSRGTSYNIPDQSSRVLISKDSTINCHSPGKLQGTGWSTVMWHPGWHSGTEKGHEIKTNKLLGCPWSFSG